MKKLIVLFMLVAGMLLTACGASEELTTGEVLEQAVEANEALDSYSADMKVDTQIMGMEVTIEAKSDITHNPDTMYMEMVMGMPGISMDLETYVAEEEVYMGMFGEWFIVEEEELGLESFDQLNKEEMGKLNAFADEFEMTEEEGVYILKLTGEGEKFEQLIEPYLEASMGDMAMDPMMDEDLFADIAVKSMDMEIRIHQETLIMQAQTVSAELEVDGETYQVNAETSVYNVNEVEPIEIPEEVKENAVLEEDFMAEGDYDYVEEQLPVDEIREKVDFEVPEVSVIPEGYELSESYYFSDEFIEMVSIMYEKDFDNYFTLHVYPSKEAYGEMFEDVESETVTVNGNEGTLEIWDDQFLSLLWEHNDVFLELMGEGPDATKELLLEIAESVE